MNFFKYSYLFYVFYYKLYLLITFLLSRMISETKIFYIVNKYGYVKHPESDDDDDNYPTDDFQITISKETHEIKNLNNNEIPIITISNNLIINTWSIENEINHAKYNAFLIKLEKEYIMIGSGLVRKFRSNENDEIISLFSLTSPCNSQGNFPIITIALSKKYMYFQVSCKYLPIDYIDMLYKRNTKNYKSSIKKKHSDEFISAVDKWNIKNIFNNNYEWSFYESRIFEESCFEALSDKKYNNNYFNIIIDK